MNIADIIYKSFEGEKAKPERKEVTFAPSYLSKCGRAIYYDKTGQKSSNPPELPSLLKMEWGNILHKDIQERLKKAGVLESFEEWKQVVFQGLTFNYFYDGIVNIDGQRAILEIKTVYSSGYSTIEDRPKDEHVLQCLSYMIFENIDKGVILYAGRDNGYLKQHYVNSDMPNYQDYLSTWEEKVSKMVRIKSQIENKELPERDYQIRLKNKNGQISHDFQHNSEKVKSDWQCLYCSHKDTCWKDVYAEIGKHKFYLNGKFE